MRPYLFWTILLAVVGTAVGAVSFASQARVDDFLFLTGDFIPAGSHDLKVGGFYSTNGEGGVSTPAVCDPAASSVDSYLTSENTISTLKVRNWLGESVPFLSSVAEWLSDGNGTAAASDTIDSGYAFRMDMSERRTFNDDQVIYAYLGEVLAKDATCRDRIFFGWKQQNKCTVIISDALVHDGNVIGYRATNWCIFPHSEESGFYTGKPIWAEEQRFEGFFKSLAVWKEQLGLTRLEASSSS